MERRIHPRQIVDMEVRVTDLNDDTCYDGRVSDLSRSGLCVTLQRSLAPGSPIRIEVEDSKLYGFVAHSQEGEQGVRIGIELQQVLMGATDLSRLLENNLRAFLPETSGLSASETYLG